MLKDILQKYDKEIFTDEMIEQISEVVEKEVSKRVDERAIEIKRKSDSVLEELEGKLDTLSAQFEKEQDEKDIMIVEALSTYLDDLKEEVFEENKIDYENVAVVKEAIEVHKANMKIQKLYNIETSDEKVQENEELKKAKVDVNKYHSKLKEAQEEALQAQKDLRIYMLAEGLEDDKKDELLAISETLKDGSITEFTKSLTESKERLLAKKVDEVVVVKKEDTKVEDKKEAINEDTKVKKVEYKYSWLRK